eukprot:9486099-Karenia_brevis.AAC.1
MEESNSARSRGSPTLRLASALAQFPGDDLEQRGWRQLVIVDEYGSKVHKLRVWLGWWLVLLP